jgi:WD40 repeat protein
MRTIWIALLVGFLVGLAGCGAPVPEIPPMPTGVLFTPIAAEPPVTQNAILLAKVGHGAIHDLVYTPDGKLILAAFETGLGVLDANNLEQVSFWDVPAALSRLARLGEKEVALLSGEGQILFVSIDPNTGRLSASLRAPLPEAARQRFDDLEHLRVAASPDGRFLALATVLGGQRTVQAWDLQTGQLAWSQKGNPSTPDELSFSKDSQYMLIGESGGQSYSAENTLVRLSDGQVVWSAKGNSWLARGESLVYWPSPAEYVGASLSAPETQSRLGTTPDSVMGHRFISPDGLSMAYLNSAGQVSFLGVPEPGVTGRAFLNQADDSTQSFFEDPLYLFNRSRAITFKSHFNNANSGVSRTTYSLLLVKDSEGGYLVKELTPPFELTYPLPQVVWSPDGGSALYAQGAQLVKINVSSEQISTFSDKLTSGITALAFAPDGKTLVAGSQDFTLTYLDPAQNLAEVRREPLQAAPGATYPLGSYSRWYDGVTGLAFSLDGSLLAAGTSRGALYLTSPAGNSPPIEIPLHDKVFAKGGLLEMFGLDISPINGMPATGGYENAVRLWSNLPLWTATSQTGGLFNISHRAGTVQMTVLDDTSVVTALAYAPDGRLAAGTEQGFVRLWRTDGTLERSLSGHTGRITGLAWAGGTLVSASEDGSVRFWQGSDGAQTRLLALGVSVSSLALDGRGELLALGAQNGRVFLWDMGTGRWLGQIPGVGLLRALAFSPDSTQLAVGSESGQIQLWQVRLANGQLAQFPLGAPQDFASTCQLNGDVRGFKEGLFVAGSPARLGWELTYSGDCSTLGADSLREVDSAPSLEPKYTLTSTYGYPQLPRLLNTLHIWVDVTIPAESGAYTYVWELAAPDRQIIPIKATLTILPASGGVNLPAPVYFVAETQALLRLETDGQTLTPIIEAPVDCLDISPPTGEIAYLSQGALWLADLNGGNRRVLLPIGGCPSWSTDGTRIGFTLNGVKVVNVASGEIQTLARDLHAYGTQVRRYRRVLDWSPYSNKFIASVGGWEWGGLKVFDLPTGSETGLTGFSNPSWSLDGEYIYTANPEYSGYDGTPPYLLRTRVTTGQKETLLGDSETDLTGAFAPFETADGRLLAFIGQSTSTETPITSLAAARVSLQSPGQFTYDPNPHPILLPDEIIWWRDGSAALVKLAGGEALVSFPFSSSPNISLPLRGNDFRWNRFAPAMAFVPAPTASPAPETAQGSAGDRLAYLGGPEGTEPQLFTLRADGSGQMGFYPSLAFNTPLAKFAWAKDGQSLFALTQDGNLLHIRPLDSQFYEYAPLEGLPGYVSAGDGLVKDFLLSPDGLTLAVVYTPQESGQFDLPDAEKRLGRDNLGLLDLKQKRWVDVNIPAISTNYSGQAAILFSTSSWSKDSQQLVVSVTQNPNELEAQASAPTFSLVAYHSGGSGSEVVSLLLANRRGQARNLTLSSPVYNDATAEFHPFWATDGQIYFYSTNENGNPGLYRISPSGKGQTRLADCESMDITAAAFAVSPNGKYIAARAFASDTGDIHWAVIPTSGAKLTFLPLKSEPVEMPVWSPNGRQLAWFFLDATLTPNLFLFNAVDGSLTSLTLPAGLTEAHALAWSPDGQALVFRSYIQKTGRALFVLPLNGRPAQPIARDVFDTGALVWSLTSLKP